MTTNPHKRRDMDIMKLMMSDYVVDMEGNGSEFVVEFHGPKDSLYEGGLWQVHVTLPRDYPYHSPSIGFKNRLFHPNVDEMSGSVCLDVINQTWSPMYELVNIFDMFLPQLLSYPNASDPLNSEAAALMMQDYEKYSQRVKDYVRKFAQIASSVPTIKKNRHPSTDSSASSATISTVRSDGSASTFASEASSATMLSQTSNSMEEDDKTPSSTVQHAAQSHDDDDDLSSLSDGDDDDDEDLVLDL